MKSKGRNTISKYIKVLLGESVIIEETLTNSQYLHRSQWHQWKTWEKRLAVSLFLASSWCASRSRTAMRSGLQNLEWNARLSAETLAVLLHETTLNHAAMQLCTVSWQRFWVVLVYFLLRQAQSTLHLICYRGLADPLQFSHQTM